MGTKPVSLTLDEKLLERLRAEADERGMPLSTLINRKLTRAEFIASLPAYFAEQERLGFFDPEVIEADAHALRVTSERINRGDR